LISVLAFVLASFAEASNPPATTAISDVLYRADGTPASGTLVISWPSFTTANKEPISAGVVNVHLASDGRISLPLVPTQNATPAGVVYKVVLKANDGTSTTEYWNVPTTPTATLANIRVSQASSGSNVTQSALSTKLDRQGDTPVSLGSLRFANAFNGNSASDKIRAAMSNCGSDKCPVIIPGTMADGAPGLIPDNVTLLDFRNRGPNEVGEEGQAYYAGETMRRRVTATEWGLYRNFYSHMTAASGGINNYGHKSGLPEGKTDYDAVQATTLKYTEGQSNALYGISMGFGNGDNIGAMLGADCYGGWNAEGDEGCEGIRSFAIRSKYVFSATVSSRNGDTIVYSGAQNDGTQGQGRPLIVTTPAKVYSTGTIAGTTYDSGQNPTGCQLVGSGTAWATKFGAGAHSNLFIAFDAKSWNGGANKFVVPIANVIDDTHIRLYYLVPIISESNCPVTSTDLASSATYKIYYGGKVLAAPGKGQPFTVDAGTGTHFAPGDTIENPLHYAMALWGMYSNVSDNGDPNVQFGALFHGTNTGSNQTNGVMLGGPISNAIYADTGALASGKTATLANLYGPFAKGIVLNGSATGTIDFLSAYDVLNYNHYLRFDKSSGEWSIGCSSGSFCKPVKFTVWGSAGIGAGASDGIRLAITQNSSTQEGLTLNNAATPNAGVHMMRLTVSGSNRFVVENTRTYVSNGVKLNGYSDSETTQTFGLDSATGNVWAAKFCYNAAQSLCDYSGAGAPTGACTTGSTYRRSDGTAGATFYVCEAGNWAAK
jgi:hypothetical protein